MRLALGTDVMLAAIRRDTGASRRLLVAGLVRGYTLVLSVPLAIECEAVMTRPEHLAAPRLVTFNLRRFETPAIGGRGW